MDDLPLDVRNVSKTFRQTNAVGGLSFAVRSGTVFGLLGPNGSGKTTTLRMILSIILPDDGEVLLWGGPPAESARERVGYLPEERGLYPKMRVLDHLVFLGELHGMKRAVARAAAEKLLSEHESSDWEGRNVEELSKGQQQTVQLIGALVHDPPLVILDEPFTGLDPVNTTKLRALIRSLRARGTAILLSTHRMEEVEQLCDEICLVAHGTKLLSGNVREIKARSGRDRIELLVDGDNGALSAELEREGLISAPSVSPSGVRARVAGGTDPGNILRKALAAAPVLRFEISEPTIEEIFVEAVTRP